MNRHWSARDPLRSLFGPTTIATFVAVAGAVWLARRLVLLVVVEGTSMTPTYRPGERIVARRLWSARDIRRGDVIVFKTPTTRGGPTLRVKRVVGVAGDASPLDTGQLKDHPPSRTTPRVVPIGHVSVAGDAPHSETSAELGFVPVSDIVARTYRAPRRGYTKDR